MQTEPLIICAKNSALPFDAEEKQQCLQALTNALTAVCADFGIDPDGVTIYDGHAYAQVARACPDCGDQLRIANGCFGPENGADAIAHCSCGFEGRAVYRLIDIERNVDVSLTDGPIETGSTVADGSAQVQFTPFETTDIHFPE